MGVAADDHLGFCSDGALENQITRASPARSVSFVAVAGASPPTIAITASTLIQLRTCRKWRDDFIGVLLGEENTGVDSALLPY